MQDIFNVQDNFVMQDIPLEQAIESLLAEIKLVNEYETLPLQKANGRILAEDIWAPFSQPPFDRSPLDGYAFKAEDSLGVDRNQPVKLKVIGEVCAGDYFDGEVKSKEAVRIMTGAPIPKGCNTVIRQEDTDYGEEEVAIYKNLKAYDNYCFAGEDIKEGQKVLSKGEKLSAIKLGVLASLGYYEVSVYRQPKVALICTGDELILPGEPLEMGKIYNSNGIMLEQRGEELGISICYLKACGDTAEEIAKVIKEHIEQVDLWITTGGVSVGKKDIMHEVIKNLGAKRLFWRVQIQPGTPVLAFNYRGLLVVGLSGNPFAALTNFELLVRPILAKMTGDDTLLTQKVEATLCDAFHKKSKKRRFIRAKYENGKVYLPHHNHSSGSLYTMSLCNALIEIPAGTPSLEVGEKVQVILL